MSMYSDMKTVANVLSQSTELQAILKAVDADAVINTHTYFGTSDGEEAPQNHWILGVNEYNINSEAMGSDSGLQLTSVKISLVVQDFSIFTSPDEHIVYDEMIEKLDDFLKEVVNNFLFGDFVDANNGTGKIPITNINFAQDEDFIISYDSDVGTLVYCAFIIVLGPKGLGD